MAHGPKFVGQRSEFEFIFKYIQEGKKKQGTCVVYNDATLLLILLLNLLTHLLYQKEKNSLRRRVLMRERDRERGEERLRILVFFLTSLVFLFLSPPQTILVCLPNQQRFKREGW